MMENCHGEKTELVCDDAVLSCSLVHCSQRTEAKEERECRRLRRQHRIAGIG